jgi:hypothetical protein
MISYGLIILVSLFGNGLVLGIILRSVFIIDSSVYAAKCLVQCIMHRSVFSTLWLRKEKKLFGQISKDHLIGAVFSEPGGSTP